MTKALGAHELSQSVVNRLRLNSATGYIAPMDMLAGRQQEIHAERDRKLEAARHQRQSRRRNAAWRAKRPDAAMSDSQGKRFLTHSRDQ